MNTLLKTMIFAALHLSLATCVYSIDTLQVASPDPILEKWRWTVFDRKSGLVGEIQDILVDNDNNIWFGTNQGVQCYDGYQWQTYNDQNGLCDNNVRDMYQTTDGTMWFTTLAGKISRFNPKSKLWTTYGTEDGLTGGSVWNSCLYQTQDGTLWAGFTPGIFSKQGQAKGGGLNRFNGTHWASMPVPDTMREAIINAICETPDGSLWIGTLHNGVYQFDKQEWIHHDTESGLIGKRIEYLMVSHDGTLWAACHKDGISRLEGNKWHQVSEGIPPKASVFGLFQTPDGKIWASGNNSFLGRFDGIKWQVYPANALPKSSQYLLAHPLSDGTIWFWDKFGSRTHRFDPNGIWTVYTHPDGLKSSYQHPNGIWTVYTHPTGLKGGYQHPNGTLWFHTARKAIQFKNGLWLAYGPEDGFLNGQIRQVYQTAQGNLWFCGTHRDKLAYALFDGLTWQIFTAPENIIDTPHHLLEDQSGNTWFSGRHQGKGAICQFDGQNWHRYGPEQGITDNLIARGYQASDGSLWFGGDTLYQFDNGQWISYDNQLATSTVVAITDFAEWPIGTLWLGSLNGLSRVNLSRVDDPQAWWHKTDFPVMLPKIRNFVPTAEALWFGFLPTRGAGVVRYDGQEFQYFTEGDGLASSSVSQIFKASDGALWCLGGDGISRFAAHSWTQFTSETGPELVNYIPRYLALRETSEGDFWITTDDDRLLHFRFASPQPPPETFQEKTATEISSAGNILLRWSGRDRWNTTPTEHLRFQWRLDNQPWSIPTNRTDTTFTELKTGTHQFEVRALDLEGEIDDTPAIHRFTVAPPWWQNPWFLSIAAVLLGALALQTIRVIRRDIRLQKTNTSLTREIAERERLDTLLHEVQYLYLLRTALTEAQSSDEIIQKAGETLVSVLSNTASVVLELDKRSWQFGSSTHKEQTIYKHPLAWNGNVRGHLTFYSSISLSEAQKQTLITETAEQITRALEAKELQFQLLQSSRLLSLGEMAAGLAHELGQPLSVISTTAGDIYCRLFSNIELPPEQLKDMMQDLLNVVDRMDDTVNHMRVFSRDTSQDAGIPFSVNEAICNSLKLIATQLANHSISLETDLEPNIDLVLGHPHQLEQVILNLLANARDALNEKARQNIASQSWTKRLTIRTRRESLDQVVIEVEDNGIGMDEPTLERIFDPFFTTKPADKGTGLGLSISYAIIQDLCGQMTCKSRPGEGTLFHIRLPIAVHKTEDEVYYVGI